MQPFSFCINADSAAARAKTRRRSALLVAACASAVLAATAAAQVQAQPQDHGSDRGGSAPAAHEPRPGRAAPRGEPHAGPKGYARVNEPSGWNNRPKQVDRQAYQHNFQASRSYHIGPYSRPHGWVAHHWAYGQILPRAYWAPNYLIADYWLFGLEIPPVGYEWVRDDTDALLIDTNSGEILQVEYGVFG